MKNINKLTNKTTLTDEEKILLDNGTIVICEDCNEIVADFTSTYRGDYCEVCWHHMFSRCELADIGCTNTQSVPHGKLRECDRCNAQTCSECRSDNKRSRFCPACDEEYSDFQDDNYYTTKEKRERQKNFWSR